MKVINVKNMIKKIAALVCAAFALAGCEGLGSDVQNFALKDFGKGAAASGGSAYVTVGKVRASDGGISLSVVPEAVGVEAFSNFKLSMYDAASESHVELATAATLVELSTQTIEVPAGERTFFLSATRGGVTFGGSTTATLEDGSSISLSFTLWPDPNAKGGVFITVNATGLSAGASYAFTRGGGGELIPLDGAGQFAITATGATATVELSDVAPGTYTLSVLFYGDEAKTVLLNTYRELVRVSAGLVSRAERSIDLNELYEITYKYYLDGAEVTGETQIAEIIASVSGGTLPENFSRISAIALPELSHDGWEFAGWYPTASINSENKMTEIAGGSTGDKNLCAIFVTSSSVAADIYVASFGNSAGTGTQVDPLDSIAAAMAKIIGAPDSLKDWVIAINGTLEGCQSLDFSGGSAPAPSTCAKSITLTGIHAFDADAGKPKDWIDGGSGWDVSEIMYYGGVGANETNGGCAALEVTACDVPLTIKNLGIKGGYGQEGGGISFSRSDKLTLGENAYVTQNLSTNGGGGIFVDSSTVILDGGTIEQNKAIGCIFGGGGGVYITDDATFTLKSGSVLNNWLDEGAQCGGAGVCVDGGAFNMEGGTVANNVSVYNITGGVYVKGSDQFNMTGGSISGNKAYPAWYDPDASFEGRGVYVDNGAKFTMSGRAVVASDNDVYLDENCVVTIGGALTGTAPVATITPKIDAATSSYPTTAVIAVADDSGTSLPAEHSKFAVTPIDAGGGVTLNFELDAEGKIVAEGSGSGTSGNVTLYVKADGDDTNGDGSRDNPFQSIMGAASYIGDQADYSDPNNVPDSETDYIIKVIGMLSGEQSLSWWEHDPITIKEAKSITIEGATDVDINGIPQDGFTGIGEDDTGKCSLEIHSDGINVTLKNIKISGYKTGLCVGDAYIDPDNTDDVFTKVANVILDSGVLITGVQCNHTDSKIGGGVTVKPLSKLYMKSGAKIISNESYSSGGAVNINDGAYFYMQGGEISGNTLQVGAGGSGVYVGPSSYFAMSGDAKVASDNDVYLDEKDANYAKITIASTLTAESPVATIMPYRNNSPSYDLTKAYLAVTSDSGTSLESEYNKFAVTPINKMVQVGGALQMVEVNYIVNESGMLEEVSSGGGGTGGIVVTSNAGGSGMASILSGSAAVTIELRNNDEAIDFTKLKIKVGSTEYALDSLRNFVTTGTTVNENSYEFSFGSSLTSSGTVIEIYYDGAVIETLNVMRTGNAG